MIEALIFFTIFILCGCYGPDEPTK